MGNSLDCIRASRYRRLALVEKDKASADLLNQLAREAELGILFTSDRQCRQSLPRHLTQSDARHRVAPRSSYYNEGGFPW